MEAPADQELRAMDNPEIVQNDSDGSGSSDDILERRYPVRSNSDYAEHFENQIQTATTPSSPPPAHGLAPWPNASVTRRLAATRVSPSDPSAITRFPSPRCAVGSWSPWPVSYPAARAASSGTLPSLHRLQPYQIYDTVRLTAR